MPRATRPSGFKAFDVGLDPVGEGRREGVSAPKLAWPATHFCIGNLIGGFALGFA